VLADEGWSVDIATDPAAPVICHGEAPIAGCGVLQAR
jgi:hypothetical protein